MICENCKIEHGGKYGSGRFCSSKCARGFSTKAKRSLINEKVRKTIKEKHPWIKNVCKWCKNEFKVVYSKRHQETCSRSCAAKLRMSSPEIKEKISKHFSKIAKRRYKEGDTSIGWQSRKHIKMSRPEKFTNKWLLEKNFNF